MLFSNALYVASYGLSFNGFILLATTVDLQLSLHLASKLIKTSKN